MVRHEADGTASSASCAAGIADRGLEAAAGDDQPALERVVGERAGVVGGAGRSGDDRVGEPGSRGGRGRTERRRIERDRAPAGHRQPGLREDRLDQVPATGFEDPAAWQEHGDDRRAAIGEIAGQQLEDGAVEGEGDPGAVAGLAVGTERAAMAQRGQPGEGEGEDPVMRSAAGIRDEPDAACIVLVPRVVERHGEGAAVAGSVLAGRGHGQVSGDG